MSVTPQEPHDQPDVAALDREAWNLPAPKLTVVRSTSPALDEQELLDPYAELPELDPAG